MNDRVSDEQLSCLVDPCWLGEPVTATQHATRMAIIELQERRSQRCETCRFWAGAGLGLRSALSSCSKTGDWWKPSEGCSRWQPREEPQPCQ